MKIMSFPHIWSGHRFQINFQSSAANTVFQNNRAMARGGAIFLKNNEFETISHCHLDFLLAEDNETGKVGNK